MPVNNRGICVITLIPGASIIKFYTRVCFSYLHKLEHLPLTFTYNFGQVHESIFRVESCIGSTLAGYSLAHKYWTRLEVNRSGKQSLLRNGKNYCLKTFYSIGTRVLSYKTFQAHYVSTAFMVRLGPLLCFCFDKHTSLPKNICNTSP